MKSLILTILYLAKDTLHRWFSNLSSPTARVLVVFFLSLCALFFLGSYVISTKLVREQIQKQGADSVSMMMSTAEGVRFPASSQIEEMLGAESIALRAVGYANDKDLRALPIYSYDFNRTAQTYPLLVMGQPTLFCTRDTPIHAGLRSMTVGQVTFTCKVKFLEEDHPIIRLSRGKCIIVPPNYAETMSNKLVSEAGLQALIQIKGEEISVEQLAKIEQYLNTFAQLEGRQVLVVSAIKLLKNMDVLLSNQGQTRAIFCIGIACIVGILLTSLASMEFRQNEYIYTLLKSFGISPFLLVLCFIVENTIIVGLSFAASIYTFMAAQKIFLTQFSQHGSHMLQLEEIMPEIQLIGISLAICVLFSTIPIAIAANKEIGKVLK